MIRVLCLCLAVLLATPVGAVLPDEVLEDPALEARARAISKELRCLVCRNENIDSSNAGVAHDLRLLVRERLVAGDSDEEVIAYVVDRYGEYVLLRPRWSRGNALLWLMGPLALLVGGGIAVMFVRARSTPVAAEHLSAAEQARLKELTDS